MAVRIRRFFYDKWLFWELKLFFHGLSKILPHTSLFFCNHKRCSPSGYWYLSDTSGLPELFTFNLMAFFTGSSIVIKGTDTVLATAQGSCFSKGGFEIGPLGLLGEECSSSMFYFRIHKYGFPDRVIKVCIAIYYQYNLLALFIHSILIMSLWLVAFI